MPEDADQDILERLVWLVGDNEVQQGSNRAKLTCQGRGVGAWVFGLEIFILGWCLGWKYSFWQSFRKFFSVQVKELFESLKRPESN